MWGRVCSVTRNIDFLARDAFVRTNRRAINCRDVRPSVWDGHCDHMVHFSADLSLWLDSPMF